MFLPGDKIPMSAGPGSNRWARRPGLVDDPRSSKKCMALSQAKVSASNPLLGTSKGSESDGYPAPQNRGMTHLYKSNEKADNNQKYEFKEFHLTLNFSKLLLNVEVWVISLFVYQCLILSYLLNGWYVTSHGFLWPTSRSWFSNQLQDVQGFIAMAMLTQDVIEDHTNLAISSWFIIFPTSKDSINLTLASRSCSTFISSTLNSVPPLPAASWTWRFLQNVLDRTTDCNGQISFPLQLYGNFRRWCLSCFWKQDSSLGIIHNNHDSLGSERSAKCQCR